LKVYVAVHWSEEHEQGVVGVGATPDAARRLVEKARGEPLEMDEYNCLNAAAADGGPPDMVGFVKEFEVAE
jgi:hypothetical protein